MNKMRTKPQSKIIKYLVRTLPNDGSKGEIFLAVQFITGPAGSGKSTYVMDTIVASLQQDCRKKIIIMVPEQATFCYQYELVNQHGISGVLTLEVLSFQRLGPHHDAADRRTGQPYAGRFGQIADHAPSVAGTAGAVSFFEPVGKPFRLSAEIGTNLSGVKAISD